VSHLLRPTTKRGTKRHEVGPDGSQTRANVTGIVALEGGGTAHPTLGGGYWVTARVGAAPGDAPA